MRRTRQRYEVGALEARLGTAVVFAGEVDEEHPATLIRSVRSLGAGREVIHVDPVAGERLRPAVLFVRSVGGPPSLTAKDAASAAIDQWCDAVADQYLGGDEFPADGGVPPCSVTMTIRIHRSSALANCPQLLVRRCLVT